MVSQLQIGDQFIEAQELVTILAGCQVLPNLLKELIVERAIAPIPCTKEEVTAACQKFFQQHQITSAESHEAWLQRYGMNHPQFQAMATRQLRIAKFQEQTWGHKLESYFLQRKKFLDQAVYSLIRVADAGIAQELYFRIQAGEQSFGELAKEYSLGMEAHTYGILGPVELGALHPALAKQLQVSKPGQLWHPTNLGEHFLIIRLEKLLPAQLDKFMRQRLLRELFETWLKEQVEKLGDAEKSWLVAKSQGVVQSVA
ncbi:peptidylprolyl isomerase [Calothrix sp. 336/3]|uniref:peptidylprolyl isomerase n=1 Tax=Calothrix sp. 336/3 TaxID=1337936 RepID=UPI0004E32EE9|nr:peptidylprolyl isomerase [Calothrix sp. 336/3]AKG19990.1 peptidylprolyl isomerase [Calothrix sp. 336/3]